MKLHSSVTFAALVLLHLCRPRPPSPSRPPPHEAAFLLHLRRPRPPLASTRLPAHSRLCRDILMSDSRQHQKPTPMPTLTHSSTSPIASLTRTHIHSPTLARAPRTASVDTKSRRGPVLVTLELKRHSHPLARTHLTPTHTHAPSPTLAPTFLYHSCTLSRTPPPSAARQHQPQPETDINANTVPLSHISQAHSVTHAHLHAHLEGHSSKNTPLPTAHVPLARTHHTHLHAHTHAARPHISHLTSPKP
ncbi:hypothetical protein M405DRAFT_937754, partial [Rhizopogon salebrosus TDB-379]